MQKVDPFVPAFSLSIVAYKEGRAITIRTGETRTGVDIKVLKAGVAEEVR